MTETFVCADCATEFSRERARGPKPKRCPDCNRALEAAKRRHRYATDSAYRAKVIASTSVWTPAKAARRRERYATDPDYRAKQLARLAAMNRDRAAEDAANRAGNKDFEPCVVRVKRCSSCRKTLSEWDFRLDLGRPDGLQHRCKNCSTRYRRRCYTHWGAPETTWCYLCCQPNDADAWVDHLHPQSKAATYGPGDVHIGPNLVWVHSTCNVSRGNRDTTPEEDQRIYWMELRAELEAVGWE